MSPTDSIETQIRRVLGAVDDADPGAYDRIWRDVLDSTTPPTRHRFARVPRPRLLRDRRIQGVAAVAAVAVLLGTTVAQTDWIASQFSVFDASSGLDMHDATVVALLRQHDGSSFEIAEKVFSARDGQPAVRCVTTRPLPPGDPIAAPSDPLAFAGSAFCTRLDVMSVESNWQDDGSASVLAHVPTGAGRVELRAGNASWLPASRDGDWAIFAVGPGSIPPATAVNLFALNADGHVVALERVH